MDTLIIRPLTPDDAAAYRALRLANLRDFQFAHGPDYEEALEQPLSWSAQRLAKPDHHWFGAFAGEAEDAPLVGVICLHAQQGRRQRHSASLTSLMVDAGHQGRGIARRLVAHLIAFARACPGIRQLTLALTDANVPARRLYDSFGFRRFGLEPDAILHEGRYLAKEHLLLPLVSLHAEPH